MKKTEVNNSRETLFLSHDSLSNALVFLIHQEALKDDVKIHCKLGLKIVGIILADLKYNTGTHLLMNKAFDSFFASLSANYYNEKTNNRTWICIYTVAKNIEDCIKANEIVCPLEDKTPYNE